DVEHEPLAVAGIGVVLDLKGIDVGRDLDELVPIAGFKGRIESDALAGAGRKQHDGHKHDEELQRVAHGVCRFLCEVDGWHQGVTGSRWTPSSWKSVMPSSLYRLRRKWVRVLRTPSRVESRSLTKAATS